VDHAYAELHCITSFSFLRGASQPEELVTQAAALGYRALAITDECSVAGAVRAHTASKGTGLALIIGSELRTVDGLKFVLLATSRRGYGELCRLITLARRRAEKGSYELRREDIDATGLGECLAVWFPNEPLAAANADADGAWLAERFPSRLWIGVELHAGGDDRGRLGALQALGQRLDLPLTASGDVHMHVRSRRALQDTVTAIRLGTTVAEAGAALFPNGERHLRPLSALPGGVPDKVRGQIEHELALIAELRYAPFFLTVHDIVRFARGRGILCQGRGSAANSAVCYCLASPRWTRRA
jgi:error-prone DNA polymerase